MIKVENRAGLHAIAGKKAEPKPAAPPAQDDMKDQIGALAQAIQQSAEQTQQSVLTLAQIMAQNKPEPRPTSLIADVERDEFGKMVRVRISIER